MQRLSVLLQKYCHVAGFSFLFVAMVPVPREVKVAFHIFGLFNGIGGLTQVIYTSKAEECVSHFTPGKNKIIIKCTVIILSRLEIFVTQE
jgi:hypothetical protein